MSLSDHSEKDAASGSGVGSDQPGPMIYERHTGLKGLYYNPTGQVIFLGFVCFMGPGLFNALNGLGGGGQIDATVSANANTALYATFAFTAFFAGCVTRMHRENTSSLTLLCICFPGQSTMSSVPG